MFFFEIEIEIAIGIGIDFLRTLHRAPVAAVGCVFAKATPSQAARRLGSAAAQTMLQRVREWP